MQKQNQRWIKIKSASENNLKNVSLEIPHNQLVVVTGVSGSGKSSLAFDVIAKEGQRRFLETFPAFSKQFLGKVTRPVVEQISGLSPVITISQKTNYANSRSTAGTMCDAFDYIKLLFARLGESQSNEKLTKSHFSFNNKDGACAHCNGLGVEENISVDKLIADANLTIREGALVPTLPNGYIMYSQVTIDVLDQVCKANGFNVDIQWNSLTKHQKDIILNGSNKIKVPFGKHSLESRLKWTGIKAKPREEGFYKGMLPIMTDILKRDRNKNILRFVTSSTCSVCEGLRLNKESLATKIDGITFNQLLDLELVEVNKLLQKSIVSKPSISKPILEKIDSIIKRLENLGIGYLSFNRNADSLSGGETQRLRIVNQLTTNLSNILYVFDEPSIGLHPENNKVMLGIFKELISLGNTVIVIEHDLDTIRNANWIVDVGPEAGLNGGEILFNGKLDTFLKQESLLSKSPTLSALINETKNNIPRRDLNEFFELAEISTNNLKNVEAKFHTNCFNVVTGVSGAGKSSLIHQSLIPLFENKLSTGKLLGKDQVEKIVNFNQKPIGRTSRSNPATYVGLAEKLRDLFAKLPEAKELGLKKTHFSFNNKGGRCETCLGAGEITIGMHYMSNVSSMCNSCQGKRFQPEPLKVTYHNKNFAEVLELSVNEALTFFKEEKTILPYIEILAEVGLGYLKLGQSSSTLSGGEAQRIKLATELVKKHKENTLFIFDEPTTGLHDVDIDKLLILLNKIVDKGNTIICIEHNTKVIEQADWQVNVGPASGKFGGKITYQGRPKPSDIILEKKEENLSKTSEIIEFKGIKTHSLKNIDVQFPKNKLSVVSGVSGSGKSSLVVDTLHSESFNRFSESLNTYARGLLKMGQGALFDSVKGLGPTVLIGRKDISNSIRSTVGTLTNINDAIRLLFSRIAQNKDLEYTAQHFSFNSDLGACENCDGIGTLKKCTEEDIIANSTLSILENPFISSKIANYYTDKNSQFYAVLLEVSKVENIDLSKSWNELTENEKAIILFGTKDKEYTTIWKFKNKTREGEQEITAVWRGFCNYINDEFDRRKENKNIQNLAELLSEVDCTTCNGTRFKHKTTDIKWNENSIADILELTISESLLFFRKEHSFPFMDEVAKTITPTLAQLEKLGLGYLQLNRKAKTLSGGEGQRLRLAGQLSSTLFGVTYILDEPSVGLHQKNIVSLVEVLEELISNGNTVILIEHDTDLIKKADYLVELGPEAGKNGGNLIFQGKIDDLKSSADSITKTYLDENYFQDPKPRKNDSPKFGIKNCSINNLKDISVEFTSEQIIAISGVSGSGKSTLVSSLLNKKQTVYGLEEFDKIVSLNQKALHLSSIGTTSTILDIFDPIPVLFSKTEDAKAMKLSKNHFSFNHKLGKCEACNGKGQTKTAMDYMTDAISICEKCNGSRFNNLAQSVKYQNKTISEVLNLSIHEALEFFASDKKIQPVLETAIQCGIGYLQLGQNAKTLSFGESQRLKLASEIKLNQNEKTLYIFDEPTNGLHPKDIDQLIVLMNKLVDDGNTILFVEHNQQLISIANQVIQLGPEGGKNGGRIISN